MKKVLIFVAIILGIVVILFFVGRLTNSFQTFSVVSKANEPSLSMGETFFASRLKEPKLFDFICYRKEDEYVGKYIATHRICGMPGDTIEIREGDLLINGQAADKDLNLRHIYRMHQRDYREEWNTSDRETYMEGDSIAVFLDDKLVKEKNIKAKRKILSVNEPDQYMMKKFSAEWNQDKFGPIKVPANSYFVLGDNHSESNDSRYSGFVTKDDLVATALWRD